MKQRPFFLFLFILTSHFFSSSARAIEAGAQESAQGSSKTIQAQTPSSIVTPPAGPLTPPPIEFPMKTHRDKKNKFKISYPVNWNVIVPDLKKAGETPALISFAKKDKTAMVTILFSKNPAKLSAADFLNEMDHSRKMENLIPKDKRAMISEQIKKSGAVEGALGFYEFPGQTVVTQKASAFLRANGIFVVTGTYQKARESSEGARVNAVLDSFQFLPDTEK